MDRYRGFTLIELLVVITILSILIALSIAGLGLVRNMVGQTAAASNMRQIGMAVVSFSQDNNEFLPGPLKAGQGVVYNLATPDQLATVLGPYLGVNQNGNPEILKIFIPPAYARAMGALDPKEYRPYVLNINASLDGRNFFPWGDDKHLPTKTIALKQVWGFVETDQLNPLVAGQPWASKTPAKPLNDSVRLAWFFDGSVQKIDQKTMLAFTGSGSPPPPPPPPK